MEYKLNEVYGCLWCGEKPEAWSFTNLAQLTAEQFGQFTRA